MLPALALLEFSSIAMGIDAGDAMVKRAAPESIYAGVIQPGKYLVLIGGEVAEVEEALGAGVEKGGAFVVDRLFLPDVDPRVVAALHGFRLAGRDEALGIVETASVAASIEAADAGVKAAGVELLELNFEGLGGKGYLLFGGAVGDVEAAVAGAVHRVGERLVASVVIPQAHPEMVENLEADGRFEGRMRPGGG